VRQRIQGRRQLTDAYLLSLAIHHHGKLITFDRRMLALAPDGSAERSFLEILS
jgi:predicted nucleic acid-binding protein